MPTTLPVSAKGAGDEPGHLNGRKVFLIIAAFFGVIFAMNGIFMHFAFSTFGGVDAAGAYRQNFLLTEDIAAAARQNRLGWTVDGTVRRIGNNAAIVVGAKDRGGRLIDVKSIKVEMRRPTDKRLDGAVVMRRAGPGNFTGAARNVGPGQWDFLITIHDRKGDRFHSRNRIILK